MDKNLLQEKIGDVNYNYDKKKLLSWVKALPSTGSIKPNKIKKGDVFMHPIFRHPYLFLEEKDGHWLCTLLTSNGEFEEVLCKAKSRFFDGSHITKVLFTVTTPIGTFMGCYDNNTHLNKMKKELKEIMS